MESDLIDLKLQGIKINYLFVCERKLWLFDKGITMEHTSDKVLQAKIVHQYSYYKEEKKELLIDDIIMIDILDDDTIREVKYSSKMQKADLLQLYYYLYYLKQKGIIKKGIINYPKERKKEYVELDEEAENQVKEAIMKVKQIINLDSPPKAEKTNKCKKCSYYEFCWG